MTLPQPGDLIRADQPTVHAWASQQAGVLRRLGGGLPEDRAGDFGHGRRGHLLAASRPSTAGAVRPHAGTGPAAERTRASPMITRIAAIVPRGVRSPCPAQWLARPRPRPR